jgi:hypothetical protein
MIGLVYEYLSSIKARSVNADSNAFSSFAIVGDNIMKKFALERGLVGCEPVGESGLVGVAVVEGGGTNTLFQNFRKHRKNPTMAACEQS